MNWRSGLTVEAKRKGKRLARWCVSSGLPTKKQKQCMAYTRQQWNKEEDEYCSWRKKYNHFIISNTKCYSSLDACQPSVGGYHRHVVWALSQRNESRFQNHICLWLSAQELRHHVGIPRPYKTSLIINFSFFSGRFRFCYKSGTGKGIYADYHSSNHFGSLASTALDSGLGSNVGCNNKS
jgi:hypothetical protein